MAYRILDSLRLQKVATPASPATGEVDVYPKSDDRLYRLTSTGVESKLLEDTDTVQTVDAAEDSSALRAPFTVTASGDTTIVAATTGKAIRLRRLSPTLSDPDGSSNPLLTLKFGGSGTEIIRGYAISGRFDIASSVGDSLVLNLSKAGSVSGTAFYELV